MSTSKKRNLKRRIVGCFCIAAIAANMSAPVIPVISDMGVITAAAAFQPGGTITQHTVTFNTNGGSNVAMKLVQSGQTVDLPTPPTRENCTFDGWYEDEGLSIAFNPDSVITSDLQLYAKWIVNIDLNALLAAAGTSPRYDSTGVTVYYIGEGGYQIFLNESFYKISGSNLVNDAYVDVQINTNYSAPNAYIDFDNASIINSGYYLDSGRLDSVTPFFTRSGTTLTISGKLNIDTLSIYNGTGYNITNLGGGWGNLVIDSFTVKFVDEDGVTVDENYYLKGSEYSVTPGQYIDDKQKLYSISEEFPCMKVPETVSDNTTVKVSKTHSAPDNNGNCTVCEKHIAEKVTFVTNGGSDIDPVVVLTGKTVEKPADPTKEKSFFGGWYTDEECTSAYDFTAPVNKDITLYAKWTDWAVDSIAVKTPPTKTEYFEGDSFDPTGLVITVTYNSGKTEDIAYNADDFTFTPSGALAVDNTSVTITYGGKSVQQKITVEKTQVSDIEIKTAPTKTDYIEGDKFDPTGLVLTVTYNNGKTEDIAYGTENAADFTVTPSGALSESDTSVTISYGGKSVTVDVTVKKGEVDVKPSEDNFGGAQIDMPIENLIDAVLDDDDRELIEQGVDISVLMATVTIDPEVVPETDKSAINSVLDDFTIGCYIDVALFKRYSNGNPDKPVTDPSSPITISFELPQYILDMYPDDEYEYTLFCSHNGLGYEVDSWYDPLTHIMSFSSDKFSTYALGVKEAAVEDEEEETPVHSHEYGRTWESDDTYHWHECECGEKTDPEEHISDNGTVLLKPTADTDGVKVYRCKVCGYIIKTEAIPAILGDHSHEFAASWCSDSNSHWQECSCGEKTNVGQHISDGGKVTVPATSYSGGVRTYSCSVCGYVLRTEAISPTSTFGRNYPTFGTNVSSVISPLFTEKLDLSCEQNGSSLTLSWGNIKNADSFTVYYYNNGKYEKLLTTEDTSATFNNLKNGSRYKFLVKYTIKGKLSPVNYAGRVIVTINSKPIVKASAESDSVKLSWQAVPKAEKYAVYKYVDGKAVKLAEVKGTSVKINNLQPNTEYKYIVSAYVDGEWTKMTTSDIITITTRS